jgi:hypothetical protein
MIKSPAVILVLPAIMLMAVSCNSSDRDPGITVPVFSSILPDSPNDTSVTREIYYGLLTPVEVCNIFDRLDINYNDAILLPPENRDLYMSSYKAAMNMGVYGVDMGYLRIFSAGSHTMSYFNTMETLSDRLGIHDSFIPETIRNLDAEMSHPDSLTMMMNEVYSLLDSHLRDEGREGTLGLMLMGGWIEAMYLATQLAYDPEDPDPVVVDNIAGQKYSLNSLLSFMKNYYDDPMVVFYTKKLKYLNRWFDTFEIYYGKGDVSIDSVRQVITTSGTETKVSVGTLNEIRDYVARLRADITAV